MPVKCENCPLRRLRIFADMSPEEVRFMSRFKSGELTIEPGTTLLMEGSNSPQLFTALRGMGVRYKTLASGNRQVVNFIFPGDFIGLQAGVMGEMGHSVEATSRMTLCVFNRSDVWSLFKNHPERAYDLTWLSAREEHFLGEALATTGQRTAVQSIAWALLRLYSKGEALGMVDGGAMPLPYRQQDLADALGLSLVHTNKTLSALRERQLVYWSEGRLKIDDIDKLAALAEVEIDAPSVRPLI